MQKYSISQETVPIAAHCSRGKRCGCHTSSQTLAGVTTIPELLPAKLFLTPCFVLPWSPFTLGCRSAWAARAFHSRLLLKQFFFGRVQAAGLWLGATHSSCSCFTTAAICHFARMASALWALSKHLPAAIWVRRRSPSNLPACWQQQQAVPRRQPSPKILEIPSIALHLLAPSLASLASWYFHPCW